MLCSHVTHETALDFLDRVLVSFFSKTFFDLGRLALFPGSLPSAAELSRVDTEASESIAPIGIGGLSDSLVSSQNSTLALAFARGLALALVTGTDWTKTPPGLQTGSASAEEADAPPVKEDDACWFPWELADDDLSTTEY